MSCNPAFPEEGNKLLAVVMCGGKSMRIGTDKGLMKVGDSTWVHEAVAKLEAEGLPVVISINEVQQVEYGKLFDPEMLIIDSVEIPGPLCGLFSVHAKYPTCDLMIMACDLPDIQADMIMDLYTIYDNKAGEHDFMVYSNQGALEPLFGVYTAEGISKIYLLFLTGQLERFSMKHALEIANTYSVELKEEQRAQLRNYNAHEDL